MRRQRFLEWLKGQIVDISGVTGVEFYRVDDDLEDLKVTFDDGIVMHLRVVRTGAPSGEGGDDEVVVTRDDLARR